MVTEEALLRRAGDGRKVNLDREVHLRGMEPYLDAITDYQTLLAEWEQLVGLEI